jgi:hypothetical protein
MMLSARLRKRNHTLAADRQCTKSWYRKNEGIIDVDGAKGAYACFSLDDELKDVNAQNYAWLAGVGSIYPPRVLIAKDIG